VLAAPTAVLLAGLPAADADAEPLLFQVVPIIVTVA